MSETFLKHSGAKLPIICGAMYPCSNPELVAAASATGAIGVIQPLSMTYVHGYSLEDGIDLIQKITPNPIGFNAIIEKSSRIYEERMRKWIDIALEKGIRFFITALGNPKWVVDRVSSLGGAVYHDVTNKTFAMKALDGGVQGLICVNNQAGGHAGKLSPRELYEQLDSLGVPLVCAGGIGGPQSYQSALAMGYAAVQLGTRFIATAECRAPREYKAAILKAQKDDIVLSEKLTGVPVSVINTDYVKRVGTKAGLLAKLMLKGNTTKHWMRLLYSLQSFWKLKRSLDAKNGYHSYYQAGKSVSDISEIMTVQQVVDEFIGKAGPG